MLILVSVIAPVVVACFILPTIRDTLVIHDRLYGRQRMRRQNRDHH